MINIIKPVEPTPINNNLEMHNIKHYDSDNNRFIDIPLENNNINKNKFQFTIWLPNIKLLIKKLYKLLKCY